MSVGRSSRFLLDHSALHSTVSSPPASQPPAPAESDVIVILAALLCALICVVGLALVARCAWLRRSLSVRSTTAPQLPTAAEAASMPLPNKGLKKKVLRSLPKLSFDQAFPPGNSSSSSSSAAPKLSSECPICLAEFAAGDEIRVLPQCGHGFHVACVDTWLGSHSSCPSCRQILVAVTPSRCNKCGAASSAESAGGQTSSSSSSSAAAAAAAAAVVEARAKDREDRDAGRFLP